jgi:hypothetical protein
MLAHASHIFTTDQPEASRQAIVEFLAAQSLAQQAGVAG